MSGKTAHEIDAEAAGWAARIDRGAFSPGEERAFQAWLAGDVRTLGAYGRMRALALSTERARALGPAFDPADFVSVRPSAVPSRRTLLQAGGGIAAAMLVGLAATWEMRRRGTSFSTGKGETKVVALKDRSVVTLNTDSEIVVRFSGAQRGIELVRGEALFDVAKNPARPFVVAAGDTSVRVIGTSFSVSRFDAAPVKVLVREGIVEVFKPAAVGVEPLRISANTLALSSPDQGDIAARPVPTAQLRRAMAWREGEIAFEGETLAQAAAEFARYSDTKIVIDDPVLAKEEIAGLFKATDPVGFAHTVAISLNAHANIAEGEVRLTR
ncbi:MAG TPA: FecR domain-containing protein [Rhizomicrobium sp.]